MAAPGPSNQLARRAIDELMEFSGETQGDKRVEYNTLMAINDVIAKAEEKLTTKEAHLEIIEAEINPDWSLDEDLHFGNAFAANWICSEIMEYKWALFYCLPNISLEQGLKLIHTDNDVHSFFADTERSGKIHLYITHKKRDLGRYYLRNMVWVEEDVALRCSSSSPFSTRIKRKGGKTTKEDLRKKAKEKKKMVDDKPVGRKSVQTSRKGKEIMYEFPGPSPTKESQVSVTNYKRAIVNGKSKMVEVEDVDIVQPVRSATKRLVYLADDCDMKMAEMQFEERRFGKRVAIGGHGRGLGRLIGLNVIAVDDDPHVTKQVSLPARSSNIEVKDLE
ncbi:hypothetical protein Tco_0535155 [Tanacetum coccineum]